jgi:hypothetical protein
MENLIQFNASQVFIIGTAKGRKKLLRRRKLPCTVTARNHKRKIQKINGLMSCKLVILSHIKITTNKQSSRKGIVSV